MSLSLSLSSCTEYLILSLSIFAFSRVKPPTPLLKAENHSLVVAFVPSYLATIKALEEQRVKETEFYKQNTEVARANAESAKANAEANASIAKANSEASIASSNALVAFFTTVSVVALTTLALKKPELFENNAQPQNPETSPNPSLPGYENSTN